MGRAESHVGFSPVEASREPFGLPRVHYGSALQAHVRWVASVSLELRLGQPRDQKFDLFALRKHS